MAFIRRPGPTRPGRPRRARRALYMQTEVEAGHGCPITMTFAAIAVPRSSPTSPSLAAEGHRVRLRSAQRALARSRALTIGMAMTEKQGGSDVRANTTRAFPVGAEGPGKAYELVGHKFFVSAPMCDAFLVLAQAPGGLSCFLSRAGAPTAENPLQMLRLKRKMGNVSNASSETELRGALAWMIGAEGRGVPTIIEMVAMTRFDCMIGSSGGQRMAVSQALHHCRRRSVRPLLNEQPLMLRCWPTSRSSRGRAALTMRVARALDHRDDAHEDRWSGSAPRSANTGSASRRRATPTRRWSASAAAA